MDSERDARNARLGRLKWHCRRALLELDLVFQRYWQRVGDEMSLEDEVALERLLALEDHELWALVGGKQVSQDAQLAAMIGRLREL